MGIGGHYRLEIENAAASMMTEMPRSRFDYKPDGLPKEGLDPAFCVPVDFDRIVSILWEDFQDLENHAILANRYSERYLSVSRDLENLVRKLGGLLITQAVLEQQGHPVSCPEKLNIPKLTFIASYHFNKAHSAVKGTQIRNLRFYLAMLQQETHWASLILRLKATDEKIRMIREGKLEVRIVPENTEEQKQTSHRNTEQDEDKAVKVALPAALPMEKDILREAAGSDVCIAKPGKKAEAAETKATGASETETKNTAAVIETAAETSAPKETEPEEKPAADPAETGEILPAGTETGSAETEAETGIVIGPLTPEEENIKAILLDAAVRMGDRQAWETVVQASGPELGDLWNLFLAEDARRGFPYMRELESRIGKKPPSEEDYSDDEVQDEEYEYAEVMSG